MRERERERERDAGRERGERERQTDSQTDRHRRTDRQTDREETGYFGRILRCIVCPMSVSKQEKAPLKPNESCR